MGVYIKGMEKPKSCWKCEIGAAFSLDSKHCPFHEMEGQEQENYQYKIAEGCPISDVPDDGVVVSEAEFKIYSRALLTALTLRDLMINLHTFDPTSIQIRGQSAVEET